MLFFEFGVHALYLDVPILVVGNGLLRVLLAWWVRRMCS